MNAETFNARYPIGTPVVAYPGARPEDDSKATGLVTFTRSEAQLFCGHTDVVWVEGHGACIALTHVDVREIACGWNPVEATTDCDWDANCPVHGAEPDLDATVAAVGALPVPVGSEGAVS
ncbi:hypothetical protein ACFYNA_15625 [Streptomyces sp. NPDC006640]|uniref:hypothetical protein n=1 Tax=Streptomyces sp. NPDC006640 TaxID=3364754 RepID=UPI0036744AF0